MVWLYTLVGFALTAIGSFLLVGNGMGWSVSLEIQTVWDTRFLAVQAARTHFYGIFAPGIFGEMGLQPTKLLKCRGQR